MLRCSFCLALMLFSILMQLTETAPCYRQDQSVICEYALNERGELMSNQNESVEISLEEFRMHLMQLNILEILLVLNVFLLICLFFEAYEHTLKKTPTYKLNVKEILLKTVKS